MNKVNLLCNKKQPILPSAIGLAQRINPFLRAKAPALKNSTSEYAKRPISKTVEVFAMLRRYKDQR